MSCPQSAEGSCFPYLVFSKGHSPVRASWRSPHRILGWTGQQREASIQPMFYMGKGWATTTAGPGPSVAWSAFANSHSESQCYQLLSPAFFLFAPTVSPPRAHILVAQILPFPTVSLKYGKGASRSGMSHQRAKWEPIPGQCFIYWFNNYLLSSYHVWSLRRLLQWPKWGDGDLDWYGSSGDNENWLDWGYSLQCTANRIPRWVGLEAWEKKKRVLPSFWPKHLKGWCCHFLR